MWMTWPRRSSPIPSSVSQRVLREVTDTREVPFDQCAPMLPVGDLVGSNTREVGGFTPAIFRWFYCRDREPVAYCRSGRGTRMTTSQVGAYQLVSKSGGTFGAVVSRRCVVAATGCAAALTACGLGSSGPSVGASPRPAGPIRLGGASEVPVGGGRIYRQQRVVVTQPSAGKFVGLSAVCTHQGCLVDRVEHATIRCPCHGSQYGLDGSVIAGPAVNPLPTQPVSVMAGWIYLTGDGTSR